MFNFVFVGVISVILALTVIRYKEKQKELKPIVNNKKKWKTEELCRSIAENIFKMKFPSKRPKFLNNPLSDRNLELDCYCEELGIAIEYNGIQHYKYPNPFHKTKKEFMKQLERDKFKKEMCRVNDIFLIVVPYTIRKSQIRQFILDRYEDEKKRRLEQ